jgi:hypothetical protein
VNQRWQNHRDSYRPAGEVIDPRRYEVARIDDDTTAKAFVLQHHYSATYLGRARARTLRLLPDATVLSDRAIAKLLARHRGWEYVQAMLIRAGAAADQLDTAAGVRAEIARVTRPLKHPGNHRYAWAIDRSLRKFIEPKGQAYPKRRAAA